jgi:hypothetical protein
MLRHLRLQRRLEHVLGQPGQQATWADERDPFPVDPLDDLFGQLPVLWRLRSW